MHTIGLPTDERSTVSEHAGPCGANMGMKRVPLDWQGESGLAQENFPAKRCGHSEREKVIYARYRKVTLVFSDVASKSNIEKAISHIGADGRGHQQTAWWRGASSAMSFWLPRILQTPNRSIHFPVLGGSWTCQSRRRAFPDLQSQRSGDKFGK